MRNDKACPYNQGGPTATFKGGSTTFKGKMRKEEVDEDDEEASTAGSSVRKVTPKKKKPIRKTLVEEDDDADAEDSEPPSYTSTKSLRTKWQKDLASLPEDQRSTFAESFASDLETTGF